MPFGRRPGTKQFPGRRFAAGGPTMSRRRPSLLPVFALFAALLALPALAHDVPLHTVVNAFVKMEPHQAHVVIRVPLDILHAAQFPMKGQIYDISASGLATNLALRGIAQGLDIREN